MLSRTQALLGHFGGWRKGSWGGQKSGRQAKKVEPSLVPLRANRRNLALPMIPCEAPGYEAAEDGSRKIASMHVTLAVNTRQTSREKADCEQSTYQLILRLQLR